MSQEQVTICKFNQTGFCKFKQFCKKEHVNEMCESQSESKTEMCTKRHPKICRNFIKDGECGHGNKCAYMRTEKIKQLDAQQKLNEILAMALATQIKEIADMRNEMIELKIKVQHLENYNQTKHVKEYTKDAEDVQLNKETKEETIKESNKSQEKIPIFQLQCDMCKYQCEKEMTLNKHKNTKHPCGTKTQNHSDATDEKSAPFNCDECEYSCKTKKNLKKHKAQVHIGSIKSKISMCENCGKEFSKIEDLEVHMKVNHPLCQCTVDSVCDDCLEEWVDKPKK